jgi:glucose uptake protein GlcU
MAGVLLQLMVSESRHAGLAWMLCISGGMLGGSYPVFIKTPRVIAAKVSPIVFQCYKSFWVFALAWIFLLVNFLRGKPLFTFTYWGIVGASFWVPAGFAYIAAVSMCGVATAAVLNTGVNSVLQFLVSVATTEKMRLHGQWEVPLAPFYLVALVLGMAGLILSPSLPLRCLEQRAAVEGKKESASSASTMSLTADGDSFVDPKTAENESRREYVVGVFLAIVSGLLGGMKFAITSVGHNMEKASKPAAVVDSEFSVFESYMMSFGLGCALSTSAFFVVFALLQKGLRRQPLPSAEFPVMKIFGFLAGACWMGSYMCLQAANNLGGSGSFGPAGNASQLITAGLWGLLYYREVRDPRRVACWVCSAAWTISFVVLLAGELSSDEQEALLLI